MWILLSPFLCVGKDKKRPPRLALKPVRPDDPDEGIDAEKARRFRTKTEILNKRCLWATIGYVQQIIFYENYLQYFCATKVIFKCEDDHYFYKLTKNLPINSPVQRKIPAKNVLVVNGLSVRRESFTSGQNEKPCFLRHNFIFFSNFFYRWKIMLRTIHLPENKNFKKMVGLKVHGNLKGQPSWIVNSAPNWLKFVAAILDLENNRLHCFLRVSHPEFSIRLLIGWNFKSPSWIWKTINSWLVTTHLSVHYYKNVKHFFCNFFIASAFFDFVCNNLW